MKQMRHINHCNTLQDRAVPTDGSFGIPYFMKTRMTGSGTERKERHIQPVADRELQGKVGKRFFSDGKAGTLRVSRKNHPRPEGLRYFSRKPCLSGSVCRKAHVVQRAAKARVFTIKINSHESSICHKRAAGSHEDAHARNKKKENRGTRTGCQVPATGDDRTGTRFHIVEPHSGNMPPSRQEQAAGGIIQ